MKKILILGTAITNTHGVLETGDILTVSDAFADHLVKDCHVAEYLDKHKPAASAPAEKPKKAVKDDN